MKIYLGTDHAGFYLKEIVKEDLHKRGYLVEDCGAATFNEKDDYPDFIFPCVKKYLKETRGDVAKGLCIIFGGSGTGEAIAANRFKGARAIVFNGQSVEVVRLGRSHNNANILSLGARFITEETALMAIQIFQSTPFEAGRHNSRVFKLDVEN